MNLKQVTKALEEKYDVDMETFMDLYKRKLTREEIAEKLEVSNFVVRKIGDKLHLIWKKTARAESYIKYIVELSADEENESDELGLPVKENEYLTHKLKVSVAALQRARDENNFLRNAARKTTRSDSFEDKMLEVVEHALPIKRKSTININITQACPSYAGHVSTLMLSDLHCEEAVSNKDVGLANEYSWEIMQSRLDKLFQKWFDLYRGESRGIIICGGDFFTGFIHDALENTSLHPMEAVQALADILSDYATTASMIFDTIEIVVVNGNHSRLTDNIKSANKGFDLEYVFGHILKAKLSGVNTATVDISTTGYITVTIGDKILGVMHGDHFRGPVTNESRTFKVYEAFKEITGVEVDHIIQGHTHAYSHTNTHKGSYIVNGSLIGTNSYGITNGFAKLRPNQVIVQFTPEGDVETVRQIFVDA